MSAKAEYWLEEQAVGGSNAKHVLRVLAALANGSYTTWATMETLMTRTEIANERTVRKARDVAIEAGFLVKTDKTVGGSARIPVYQMLCPVGAKSVFNADGTIASRPPTLAEYLQAGGARASTDAHDDEQESATETDHDSGSVDNSETVPLSDGCGLSAPAKLLPHNGQNCSPTPGNIAPPSHGNIAPQDRSRETLEKREIEYGGSAARSPSAPVSETTCEFSLSERESVTRLVKFGAAQEDAEGMVANRKGQYVTIRDVQGIACEAHAAGITLALAVEWAARNGKSTFTRAAYAAKGGLQGGGEPEPESSASADELDVNELDVIESLAGGWNPAMHATTTHGGCTNVH
ncbi:hypothetical protein OKW30_003834 [Paraburkholderia sp. Clong3]|uniref:hypothetical protein n=1 Tax=Paraburkholderia sp. Clong3 TaxID=2991061 RepID=UPI003D1A47D6